MKTIVINSRLTCINGKPNVLGIFTLSGKNSTILRAWDAKTGHLIYESGRLKGNPIALQVLSKEGKEKTQDVVVLSSQGHLRQLREGHVVWETLVSPEFLNLSTLYITFADLQIELIPSS